MKFRIVLCLILTLLASTLVAGNFISFTNNPKLSISSDSGGSSSSGYIWQKLYSGPNWKIATTSSPVNYSGIGNWLNEIYDSEMPTIGMSQIGCSTHNAYGGSVLLPNGRILAVPSSIDQFAYWEPVSYTSITSFGPSFSGNQKFRGALLATPNLAVAIPYQYARPIIYNIASNTFINGPTHNMGAEAYWGGTVMPDGRCLFSPYKADYIGIFDPVANTFTQGPAHGCATEPAYTGACPTGSNTVVLAPYNSECFGLYDYSTNTYVKGASVKPGVNTISGGELCIDGRIVYAPFNGCVFWFWPDGMASGTTVYGLTPGLEYSAWFSGSVPLPNGDVFFAPYNDPCPYIFNYRSTASGTMYPVGYNNDDEITHSATIATTGLVMCTSNSNWPWNGAHMLIYTPFTGLDIDWVTSPFVNRP